MDKTTNTPISTAREGILTIPNVYSAGSGGVVCFEVHDRAGEFLCSLRAIIQYGHSQALFLEVAKLSPACTAASLPETYRQRPLSAEDWGHLTVPVMSVLFELGIQLV